jgi:hypothetical protein
MSYVAQFANIIVGNIQATANANFAANISTPYYFGNGYFLTGVQGGGSGTYGNSNVANYLPTYSGNLANLGGNVVTTANIQANYYLGNGAFLTGLPATYGNSNVANYLPNFAGNVNANVITATLVATGNLNVISNAQIANITSTGLVNAAVINTTGNITANANITGNYIFGNGVFLTGITGGGGGGNYSNSNVFFYMPNYNGNLSSMTGQVITTSGNIATGNGNVIGLAFFGNVVGNTAQFLNANGTAITAAGNVSIAGNVSANLANLSGNVTAVGNVSANYLLGNIAQATGFANITSNITTTGNISGFYFIGANANISGNILAGGNLTTTANLIAVNNAYFSTDTFTAGYSNVSGNVNIAANVNANGATISSNLVVGNASVVANLATGNILTDNILYANGRAYNFGNALSVVYFTGTTTTTASICTNTDINAVIPPSSVPKNGDIFVDQSTRVNNTQPVYIYVGGNWRQFLTAWGGV